MKFEIAINDDEQGPAWWVSRALKEVFFQTFRLFDIHYDANDVVIGVTVEYKEKKIDPDTISEFIALWGTLRGVVVMCTHVKE